VSWRPCVTYPGRVDREAIERRDFPIGRRGYDPAAVDAHLRQVADELERLSARPARLSAGTSEQVRAILEAAEASAADHVARAERAAGGVLSRLDELERELAALLDALRGSGDRLREGLAGLHEQFGAAPAPEEEEDFAAAAAPNGDEAGARLTALNMALSGTPREETARYLAEHFRLPDAEALLDDVYARAGG
jgi:DivIVA domain-containing protein